MLRRSIMRANDNRLILKILQALLSGSDQQHTIRLAEYFLIVQIIVLICALLLGFIMVLLIHKIHWLLYVVRIHDDRIVGIRVCAAVEGDVVEPLTV